MINIRYQGTDIRATDDGVPALVPTYWTQEILDGIQAAFEAGDYTVIPDPEPPPPTPDWLGFNLAMVPPSTESTFEVWLSQFKEPYRSALTVASSEGNAARVQGQYEILKSLAPPTAEQIAEWQSIADEHNIPLQF